jgi:hypothetical protein
MGLRRQFLKRLAGLAALMAIAPAGQAINNHIDMEEEAESEKLKGNFVHMVFFWLKTEDAESHKKFLSEVNRFIDHVPGIETSHIGSPADTDREVIDNTYSYSLVLSFKSKKEHDMYQEHELHKAFISNASDLWEKVQVYDSILLS